MTSFTWGLVIGLCLYVIFKALPAKPMVLKPGDVGEFCPVCKRLLVAIHPNGTFDLAAQAGVSMVVREGETQAKPIPGTATCDLHK